VSSIVNADNFYAIIEQRKRSRCVAIHSRRVWLRYVVESTRATRRFFVGIRLTLSRPELRANPRDAASTATGRQIKLHRAGHQIILLKTIVVGLAQDVGINQISTEAYRLVRGCKPKIFFRADSIPGPAHDNIRNDRVQKRPFEKFAVFILRSPPVPLGGFRL